LKKIKIKIKIPGTTTVMENKNIFLGYVFKKRILLLLLLLCNIILKIFLKP